MTGNTIPFRPSMGMELGLVGANNGLYETVSVRQPEPGKWEQIFLIYPHLERFPTKDLFSKHPSKEGFSRYVGRTDDMIALSHGEDIYASSVQEKITEHPQVLDSRVCLLGVKADQSRLESLMPFLDLANKGVSDLAKLTSDLVFFSPPEKRLVRTVKGTVSRRKSKELYTQKIDQLYSNLSARHWDYILVQCGRN